jgi:hypothetical protein
MLSSKYQHTDRVLDFSTKNLKIASDGSVSIPLTVTTSSNTSIAPHTILYGILAGISPIIFKIIQKKLKSESKKSIRYNFVANGLVEN